MKSRYSTRSASALKLAEASIKVTTYNVLSSHLSAPNYFLACKPENLDPKTRLERVKNKLTSEIQDNAIVCLQEISTLWAGDLHTFFAKNNYHFVTALYGHKFNGYMGVGMAVPKAKYDILDVDITRVADTKRLPYKPKTPPKPWYSQLLLQITEFIVKLALYWKFIPQKSPELWDNVLYRTNQIICMRLRVKADSNGLEAVPNSTLDDNASVQSTISSSTLGTSGHGNGNARPFVVGTYHMPCMFQLPSVMIAHCALSAQHIHRFARGDPYIYVGDFNIKPESSQYELLTQGQLEKTHPDYPHPPSGDDWAPTLQEPLQSAYVSRLGHEPNFTNYAKVKEDPIFCDTLDYLFHSKEWVVTGVKDLPHRDEVEGPLPNLEEPSDHILLSANFKLP